MVRMVLPPKPPLGDAATIGDRLGGRAITMLIAEVTGSSRVFCCNQLHQTAAHCGISRVPNEK